MTFVFKQGGEKSLEELGGASPLLVFGVGWESKPLSGLLSKITGKTMHTDLDLSCAIYDEHGDRVDCVWYAQLQSKDNAIRHSGDDTSGWHEGDDEFLVVDLNQLNKQVKTLFFVVSCFGETALQSVKDAYWHVFDGQTKREIARFTFHGDAKATAKIVMRLQKSTERGLAIWRIKALDSNATGKNIQEIFPEIRSLLEA